MSPTSRFVLTALFCAALMAGCVASHKRHFIEQTGESVVFIGQEPSTLAYPPVGGRPLNIRSNYRTGQGTIAFEEGRDFIVDYTQGTVRRTADSRLPDFQKNVLFGQREFDHTKFPGFGNGGFFAFVDYSYLAASSWPVQPVQTEFLKSSAAKLKAGQDFRIVAFGDSITAGGDATKAELIFWQRWANDLQSRYPKARVVAINGATGGDSTVQGLERLQTKVIDQRPDLVLVGFGMNDHNLNGVPIPQFEQNLKEIIERIRNTTGAEVILFSAFPPNPDWKFGTHRMGDYAAATERVARQTMCAYADVFSNWQMMVARKKPEDVLGNNINHPNDFGHWIYFRVLQALGL